MPASGPDRDCGGEGGGEGGVPPLLSHVSPSQGHGSGSFLPPGSVGTTAML